MIEIERGFAAGDEGLRDREGGFRLEQEGEAEDGGARNRLAQFALGGRSGPLGVVEIDQDSFVMADIPGLIEGAHDGAGLGDRFLGHIERCGALLHLIDGTAEDVARDWQTIRDEIVAYGNGLDEKETVTVLNKCDALQPDEIASKRDALAAAGATDVMNMSGVSGEGVPAVLRALYAPIREVREEKEPATAFSP